MNHIQQNKTTNHSISHAGFWIRLAAYFIDGFLVITVASLLTLLTGSAPFAESTLDEPLTPFELVSLIVSLLYFIIMPVTKFQGTYGKAMLGIKIVDHNYKRISFLRSIGRYLSWILASLIFFIGFLLIPFTKRKIGLHDLIVSTYVVHDSEIKKLLN